MNVDEERISPILLAKRLRVHVATVWRWILHGVRGRKLRSITVGGRRFILRSDLEDFLRQGNPKRPPLKNEVVTRAAVASAQLNALGVK